MSSMGQPDNSIRLSNQDASLMVQQIAELAQAGLPLDQGLEALAAETKQGKLRNACRQLAQEIRQGSNPFSEREGSTVDLPRYYDAILRAGVASNRIGDTLVDLLDTDQWRNEYWRTLRATLAYPVLLVIMALLVLDLLNAILLPGLSQQFLDVYAEFELDLPTMTPTTKMTSNSWIGSTTIFIVGLLLAPLAMTSRQAALLRRSIPIFGKIIWWNATLDLVCKLRMLLAQGLPVSETMRCLDGALVESRLNSCVRNWAYQIDQGKSLSTVWQDSIDIPPSIVPMVRWGETQNELVASLEAIQRLLRERLVLRQRMIYQVAPPIVTIVILGAVTWAGIRMVAMVIPLIDLVQNLS